MREHLEFGRRLAEFLLCTPGDQTAEAHELEVDGTVDLFLAVLGALHLVGLDGGAGDPVRLHPAEEQKQVLEEHLPLVLVGFLGPVQLYPIEVILYHVIDCFVMRLGLLVKGQVKLPLVDESILPGPVVGDAMPGASPSLRVNINYVRELIFCPH